MENIEEYRQIIKQVLSTYNDFLNAYSYLNSKLIISETENSYLIVIYGLNNEVQIHDFIVHININDEQSIIEIFRDDIDAKLKLYNAGINGKYFSKHYFQKKLVIDSIISYKKVYQLHQGIFTSESNSEKLIIKPDATPAELTELSVVEHTEIAKAIAKHPNTSPSLLIKLFRNFAAEIFAHPSFNTLLLTQPKFLEKLYRVYPGVFHQKGLKIPEVFIEWAINHERESVRANIAGTHDLPACYLEKLADDESCQVIAYLIARTCYPSSDPATHFSSNVLEKVEERYQDFTDNCPNKNALACECVDILANV